jgi:hypothetical protein
MERGRTDEAEECGADAVARIGIKLPCRFRVEREFSVGINGRGIGANRSTLLMHNAGLRYLY